MTPSARSGDPLAFKVPNPDAVASIVARDLHGTVTRIAEVAVQGGVNRTFLATAADRQLIVRVNEAAELTRFQKEAWAISHSAAAGVPSPEVLSVGVDGDLAYMIESYVEGPSGDTFNAGEQRSAWREIGTLLKRIHSVPVGGFGEELADMSDGGSTNWDRYLEYNLSSLDDNDPLLAKQILDKSTQQRLKSSFAKLKSIPKRFGLSHGDMSLKNVISHDGRLHVVDWGEANAHFVPHFDLGVILEDSLDSASPEFAELLTGYGLDLRSFRDLEPDIHALRLLIRTDKVRWAMDRKPERLPGRINDLKRFMEQVAR